MSGQIIDASIVAAPTQRDPGGEKRDIKEGRIPPAWVDKPAQLRQKDRDARWTVKYTKAKPNDESGPRVDLAVPAFGYKNHLGIDCRHRLIRRWRVTDAARHDGALLRELIDPNNTASDVWADTAYRSKANETFFAGRCCARRSTVRNPSPSRCRAGPLGPMPASQQCARRSSTSLPARRGPWAPVHPHHSHRPGSQHLLDHAQAQREPKMQPYCGAHDLSEVAMAGVNRVSRPRHLARLPDHPAPTKPALGQVDGAVEYLRTFGNCDKICIKLA
jgi:Transposase DDE domain